MAHSRLLLGLACLGVSVCAACGSSFTGGAAGMGGSSGDGAASSDGGSSASAGSHSAGAAGETSAGAAGASAGSGGSTAGSGGSSAGAGGSSGKGGSAGSAGTGGAADCKTLEAEYTPLLEKARVCDKGSTDQCSATSKLSPVGGCGCPVLVNTKSEATTLAQKKYQELEDNKCLNTGPVCNVACLPVAGASCEQMSGMGNVYLCTALGGVAN